MKHAILILVLAGCGPISMMPDSGARDGGDGGTGVLPVTCLSNNRWDAGNTASEAMNPGLACRACHLGQNFLGQNPTLESNVGYAMFFMGTVYGDFNEANLCVANGVPAGAVVEILDSTGALKLTLPIDPSGNFRSDAGTAPFPLPYRARVRSNGRVRPMGDVQTNGDCNTCHTEQGREGAPGRIIWP